MAHSHSLITLGTGSSYAERGVGSSSHLVQTPDIVLLMDAGEGCAGSLNYLGKLDDPEFILISHLHSDHISGLFVLIQNLILKKRKGLIRIYMPSAGIEPVKEMLRSSYLEETRMSKVGLELEIESIKEGNLLKTGETSVSAWNSDHFIRDNNGIVRQAYGFSIDSKGSRLVYTADVTTIDCFLDQIKPGCTVLCEAMHLDYKDTIRRLSERNVRKIIFTHIDPQKKEELKDSVKSTSGIAIARDCEVFEW